MRNDTGTWHHGLIARYWAEFNVTEPDELAYYRAAIERSGEPVLDLGCGTGRLLLPLLDANFDVEGADISRDMLALCRERGRRDGLAPTLHAQAMHELDLPRRYRTIYICDSFGIGGRRDRDLETLRRVRRHLEPGGALVFSQELPINDVEEDAWARWLPGRREGIPRAWPTGGERRRAADGDEYELVARLASLDPLEMRRTLEMRARLWRDGAIIAEEVGRLDESLYFVPEVQLMLGVAGFANIAVQGRYNGRPATPDDGTVVFVARA